MIRAEDWAPTDGLDLEPNALRTVTTRTGNVVVTAGPGAGKTELLAQRADFLFRTGLCWYPQRILAISFKVDATRNLRNRVRSRSGAAHAARFDSFTFHAFAKRIIDNYRLTLTGDHALDAAYQIGTTRIAREQIRFEDLGPLAVRILRENEYARGAVRKTFSHVLLDEFQDTTDWQYALLRTAFKDANAALTAVGDVKQRIMGWAGALDGILQTFADDFAAESFSLYKNFRSAPRLLRMQNQIIKRMDRAAASPDEHLKGEHGRVEVLSFASEEHEATEVANRVAAWLDAGVPASDVAVLARQHVSAVTESVRSRLHELGIACRDEHQMQDVAAEPVVALIFNFIRVIADDAQPAAYAELVRVGSQGSVMEETAQRFDRSLKGMLQDFRAAVRAKDFDASKLASWEDMVAQFLALISESSLVALSQAYQQGTRIEDLITTAMKTFGSELSIDGDPVAALRRLSEADSVRFLTIHKCKGLEFDRVVLVGVETQMFYGKPDDFRAEYFVAISRAKSELLLTHVERRTRPSGWTKRWYTERKPHDELLGYALAE